MPHSDTRVAIQQAFNQFSALNATEGHKPSFPTSYISIPNDGDDPPGYINTGFQCSKCHTSLAIQQAIYIDPK